MWTSIVATFRSFFEALTVLSQLFRESKLREAGRNEVLLEAERTATHHRTIADEIDRRPMPADRGAILVRL